MPEQQYWLVKSEPTSYSWDALVREGRTAWTGVRNYMARNHLRAMRRGDRVLFYHSVIGKAVAGIAAVDREAYADATATEGDWSCVDLTPVKPLRRAVTLSEIKAEPALRAIALFRQSRISVVPLQKAEFARIVKMGSAKPNVDTE